MANPRYYKCEVISYYLVHRLAVSAVHRTELGPHVVSLSDDWPLPHDAFLQDGGGSRHGATDVGTIRKHRVVRVLAAIEPNLRTGTGILHSDHNDLPGVLIPGAYVPEEVPGQGGILDAVPDSKRDNHHVIHLLQRSAGANVGRNISDSIRIRIHSGGSADRLNV